MELTLDALQMLTAEEERPHGADPAMCYSIISCWASAEIEFDGDRQVAVLAAASNS
ncbi:ALQxL family class IV lanthipeptide [Streptomyces sp. NBC_01537]|uniref:ALQxL family class IV lanthipeptide n=1 Tax=Streptomyces sp. NBC_01537 TaxID=2903896 RepID=UPI00386A289F